MGTIVSQAAITNTIVGWIVLMMRSGGDICPEISALVMWWISVQEMGGRIVDFKSWDMVVILQ
jgi:hypothetical protein